MFQNMSKYLPRGFVVMRDVGVHSSLQGTGCSAKHPRPSWHAFTYAQIRSVEH